MRWLRVAQACCNLTVTRLYGAAAGCCETICRDMVATVCCRGRQLLSMLIALEGVHRFLTQRALSRLLHVANSQVKSWLITFRNYMCYGRFNACSVLFR